jgi:mannosyltransferase OCH1-like enzyme
MMIPKVIHYCWFGRNPLPESAVKCIESWRKFMPGYEIKEWNEDNFDVNIIPYTAQAYSVGKYAFVSDYARFWILYHYGGVYFDTDVEVIKPIDDIAGKGPFMGIESMCKVIPEDLVGFPMVNPGLGIGAPAGTEFYKKVLDYYSALSFLREDGSIISGTVVAHTTRLLVKEGLQQREDEQQVAGMWIYPEDYFNPFDDITGRLKITGNTRSIHWYARTWMKQNPVKLWLSRMSHRVFGIALFKLKKKLGLVE